MEISRPSLKANARLAIGAAKPHPSLVILVWVFISYILSYLSTELTGYTDYIGEIWRSIYYGYDISGYMPFTYNLISFRGVLVLAIYIMSMVLSIGVIIYTLNVSRRRPASFGTLFDGFSIFLKVIGLNIVMGIFTFLWSLLFFFPGIVALYRYRQAPYLLIDNPSMSIMACIRESKRLMIGRKSELFVLDLSFLGWFILEIIPFVSIWVTPYTMVTYAGYYNALLDLDARNSYIPTPPSWPSHGGYGDSDGHPRTPAGRDPWDDPGKK